MTLVAGVDTSTQSCKVVIRDAETGASIRMGSAPHPEGTECHPDHWWAAFQEACEKAGGLDDVSAIAVGGQQHGMVCLDKDGEVVRPALLWNDNRSARAADDLISEQGRQFWAESCGSILVASFTVTKLRWLRDHEPENASRVAAVCLPHDWLTWRIAGHGPRSQGGDGDLFSLVTDRSDASGTGYWSPFTSEYLSEILEAALGSRPLLPRVLGISESAGTTNWGAQIGPGAGDNAAAALGLGLLPGDVSISLGTSGVVSAISSTGIADRTGVVAGFADATGSFLPLVCTLNASRILDSATRIMGISFAEVDALALSAPAGAEGLRLVPFFEGERTPPLPQATAALHGMTLANCTPQNMARAFVEALLCCQAGGLEAISSHGFTAERVFLIGGGAKSAAVRQIAPSVFGCEVVVPPTEEWVAIGSARQAAWVLAGTPEPPTWRIDGYDTYSAPAEPIIMTQYQQVQNLFFSRD
ncbi:MAG: xylulose kinase [Propionibacteriaceae bacterium]|jgi:xylulokinase|nr:xylulose kinase [Propionibacteriaceae bacterium]